MLTRLKEWWNGEMTKEAAVKMVAKDLNNLLDLKDQRIKALEDKLASSEKALKVANLKLERYVDQERRMFIYMNRLVNFVAKLERFFETLVGKSNLNRSLCNEFNSHPFETVEEQLKRTSIMTEDNKITCHCNCCGAEAKPENPNSNYEKPEENEMGKDREHKDREHKA
jgi:hypothetical protein